MPIVKYEWRTIFKKNGKQYSTVDYKTKDAAQKAADAWDARNNALSTEDKLLGTTYSSSVKKR